MIGVISPGGIPIGFLLIAAPPQPKANWSPCYREFGQPFECTTVQVPLDYSNPGQAAISIAMIRLPALNPGERIGSLFLNPGGPGGSGVDFALSVSPFLYTPEVRARFDLVGFDPRGIARSTALRYAGAVTVANLLPNSRLLSLDGWGHASLFLSQCIDQAVSDYLVSGVLPAEGTVCNQDLVPFIDFSALSGAAELSAARRSLVTPALLPDMVKKGKK